MRRRRLRPVTNTSNMNGRESNPGREAARPAVIDIFLETRLEDIPDGGACEVCGQPTQKTFLEHKSIGADVVARAKGTAGYRCQDPACGVASFSNEALVESLTKASRIFCEYGDLATAEACARRIEVEQRIIEGHRTAPELVSNVR